MYKDLKNAKLEDPEGAICGFCGKENTFCDNIGWFYLSQKVKVFPILAACEDCHAGSVGQLHRKRYGVGDI